MCALSIKRSYGDDGDGDDDDHDNGDGDDDVKKY
jgi:hypothetical protein